MAPLTGHIGEWRYHWRGRSLPAINDCFRLRHPADEWMIDCLRDMPVVATGRIHRIWYTFGIIFLVLWLTDNESSPIHLCAPIVFIKVSDIRTVPFQPFLTDLQYTYFLRKARMFSVNWRLDNEAWRVHEKRLLDQAEIHRKRTAKLC